MFAKLDRLKDRYLELNEEITQPDVVADYPKYQACLRELQSLEAIVSEYNRYLDVTARLSEAESLSSDPEMAEIAKAEADELIPVRAELLESLKYMLVPPDPLDNRNVILELRAGAGGEEAALFTGDLLRMYRLYAQGNGLDFSPVSVDESDLGGVNEALITVSGKDAYGLLKFESGVHSVKRVPVTESAGRIHTSTATVAVFPEAEEVELTINPEDIRIDVYHASGHGGQGVNTTDSAVRMTHIPTGMVVTCQDERSQLENKAKALKVLRSRLLDRQRSGQAAEKAGQRRELIGTGDRSEKIRTYYFNHDYVTDHRLSLTVNRVSGVMNGGLQPFTEALRLAEKTERMKSLRV
ncbi:MAG: peptide chain release factor 1 [Clostridia bacterium]|nr:peptide chain release factor 1 [Clostridia bacterium]